MITKPKIFKEFAPKFRSIYGVTSVKRPDTKHINVVFKYKTDTMYNRIRQEAIDIIDTTPHLKFVRVTGANYNITKADYCVIIIEMKI
jgi:hypothetical protein